MTSTASAENLIGRAGRQQPPAGGQRRDLGATAGTKTPAMRRSQPLGVTFLRLKRYRTDHTGRSQDCIGTDGRRLDDEPAVEHHGPADHALAPGSARAGFRLSPSSHSCRRRRRHLTTGRRRQ